MEKSFTRKLLFIVPIFILLIMLFMINSTISYFENTNYNFVYNTNKGSVQRFSRELDELISEGYSGKEYNAMYLDKIKAFTKTNGEKYAIVSFLLDEDTNIYYGNDKSYVSALLTDPNNENALKDIAISYKTGEVTLNNNDKKQTWFYQLVTDGDKNYYVFMGVDSASIKLQLNENRIVIPIFIFGLILILTVEYLIWTKIYYNAYKKECNI